MPPPESGPNRIFRYNAAVKYNLRTLMIVVTLICVLLAGRIAYLRKCAEFHDREQARHLAQWRQEYASSEYDSNLIAKAAHERELYFHHKYIADQYRKATHRPWILVNPDQPHE